MSVEITPNHHDGIKFIMKQGRDKILSALKIRNNNEHKIVGEWSD